MAEAEEITWIVLWDFDNSLINENVDYYIPRKVWKASEEELETFRNEWSNKRRENGITFTQHMGQLFELLQSQGVTQFEIESAIESIPDFKHNLEVITALSESNFEQMVVSDANTYFIETYLKLRGRRKCFSAIYSHKASFSEGCIKVTQWTDEFPLKEGHPRVPGGGEHMCKSEILEMIIGNFKKRTQIIYVGDGGGDFPALTELRKDDVCMVRKGKSLEKYINKYGVEKPDLIKCNIMYWQDDAELMKNFVDVLPKLKVSLDGKIPA